MTIDVKNILNDYYYLEWLKYTVFKYITICFLFMKQSGDLRDF